MPALAVHNYVPEQKATIYTFPKKTVSREGHSTKMECLYDKGEINAVYAEFKKNFDVAVTENKQKNAMRDLTMFICAINIGLRGGDLCRLKWKDVFDDEWNIVKSKDFAPEKTERRDRCGNVIKRKYVTLRYNNDFRVAITDWLQWLTNHKYNVMLSDYIFKSNKGTPVAEETWYRTVEKVRKNAGIKHSIGTHGLRKTYGHNYYITATDKSRALVELMEIFAHSDLRITRTYICITDEEIARNQEIMCAKMGVFSDVERCNKI